MNFPPTANRADVYGTDVEIWFRFGVFADVRTAIPGAAHEILRQHGFILDLDRLGPNRRVLARDDSWNDDRACATRAAELLAVNGFVTNLDPVLASRDAQSPAVARYRRRQQAAATRASPATAGARTPGPPSVTAPLALAPTTIRRSR